jgi:2-oxoglutarate dehydrogenase E2 component (dihydrolipoamide succinyltransferase)
MTWSTRISPHATAIAECDMSNAAALVEAAGARFEASVGAPLTYTALVAQAAVKALGEFRTLNASVVGDEVILKPAVNLGVAVALPDSGELIVPVVREADGLSLAGFAKAVKDLAVRARSRRLTPDDVQGGTFTLTNPGIFGGLTGTPILNQPEVGILGLGAVTKRPVVLDDAIAIRSIMMMSLTFDHRAADGMVAFQYLARVREQLEALPTDLDTSKI